MNQLSKWLKEIRTFLGTMNHEAEDRFLPEGDYRKIINGYNGNIKDAGAVKNNLGNLLISNPFLTAGENKVIGSFEDLSQDSIIYCVYNEFGYHGIYRWYRNKPPYIYGVIEKIYQVQDPNFYDKFNENPLSFSNDHDFNITGITLVDNLLQFTDNHVRSKTIDLVRANETEKRRRFKFIINKNNVGNPVVFLNNTLTLYAPNNPVPVHVLTWVSFSTDSVSSNLSFFIGANYLNPCPLYSVHACDDHCIIEMVNPGAYFLDLYQQAFAAFPPLTTPDLIVADNFYPDFLGNLPSSVFGNDNFVVDFIDRGRYTPECCPTVVYKTDASYQLNLVSKSVFQFRTRYQYFDNSWSVYGAISKIAIPSVTGGNNAGLQDNYIEVDFTDPRLTSPTLCSVIKRVELAVNEPAIDTVWKTVKVFEQQEVVGISQAKFNFYNNGAYTAIAPALITKQFDSLPIIHKSEEYADDRSFLGNTTEGYDIPCVEITALPTYKDNPISEFHSIRGKLRIESLNGTNQFVFRNHLADGQPQNPVATVFGGVDAITYTPPQIFQQLLPRIGWTVYLAGTDLFAVSKQESISILSSIQAADGAFDIHSLTDRTLARNYASLFVINQDFEIKNVPDGEYVLRISGHTNMDTCGNTNWFTGRNYQRTSTNTNDVGGTGITEIVVIVSGADVTIPDTVIMDITNGTENRYALQGYVSANDNPVTPVTADVLWNDTRIELSRIFTSQNSLAFTDHNGYFFSTAIVSFPSMDLDTVTSGAYTDTPSAGDKFSLVNGTGIWSAFSAAPAGFMGIFRVTSSNIEQFSRTKIEGSFTGQVKSPISVIQILGGVAETDQNGFFSIYTYIKPAVTTRAVGLFFASSDINVILSFSPSNYSQSPISISVASGDYNDDNTTPVYLILTTNFTNLISTTFVSALSFKNGSNFGFAIVYMDNLDRKCAVALSEGCFVSVPFVTPQNQVIDYIEITIYNEVPDWATKFHIVRTKNLAENNFLQWAANKVEYVEEDFTTVTTLQQATFLKIDIQNIGYYTTNLHPNAAVNYTFAKGDVIIMKSNGAGVPFTTNLQYEIVSVQGTDIFIYKDNANDFTLPSANGLQFEIFTPRNKNQTNLYYEIGECYDIEVGIFGGVKKKFHKGQIQDQSFSLSPVYTVVPATIRIFDGGTYRRLRSIPVGLVGISTSPQLITMAVDDESVSDFYVSRADGTGRVNVDDSSIQQVVRETAIRFSNVYKSGTQVNGLHTFDALNDKQISTNAGAINKLKLVDKTVLKVVCGNSFLYSIYIKQATLKTATGQVLYTLSDEEIPSVNQMQRSFGTQHPESVTLNDEGDLFGWDEKQCTVWRSSGNGLISVSDYKMSPTFTEIGQARLALQPEKSSAPAVYDINKDLLIQTFCSKSRNKTVLATGYIELRDFDLALPVDASNPFIKITVQPINFVVFQQVVSTNALYPDIKQIVVDGINNAGNGYTASLTDTGLVKIEKNISMLGVSYLSLVVEIKWLDILTNPQTQSTTYLMDIAQQPASSEIPTYEAETLSFAKEKKGWVQYEVFTPEFYCKLRAEYVSFVDGQLWLHEAGAVGTFYGVYYPMTLIPVFNQDYRKVKKWKELGVNINDKNLQCPSVTTPARENVPAGMLTELTKLHFIMKHGKYFAAMTMDKNSPGFANVDQAWVNGRPMEGQSMEVTIVVDSPNEVKLTDVESIYIDSELS